MNGVHAFKNMAPRVTFGKTGKLLFPELKELWRILFQHPAWDWTIILLWL
jgi:hypothetical protein